MTLDGWLFALALVGVALFAASFAAARHEDSHGFSPEWSEGLAIASAVVLTVAGIALAVWGLLR